VIPGPIRGFEAIKKAYPKAKYIEIESIPYSADAPRTFRQFVAQGATIAFLSSNYADLLSQVSDKAPNIAWLEANGHSTAANRDWYYVKHWLPSYVTGVAAGLMTKSGKLGYVGSLPVPSVYSGVNAFLMGARSVKPNATMQVILINSWFDPQAAAQAGTALIDNGCDFLFGIMDEAAYLQVAEKRGVPAVMWNTDVRRYGPKSYVSSIVVDWTSFYVGQVKERLAGTWTGNKYTLLDMGKGVDRDAWGESVPDSVRMQADAEDLSAGEQQRVEILRVLARGARVLILDEPTAVLTPPEASALARALRGFVANGYAVVFISHKLDEVLEIADQVTVLRGGKKIATLPAAECGHAQLATLMVGREVRMPTGRSGGSRKIGLPILQLSGVCALNERGLQALNGVDLTLHAGEIFGVAGVAGNGQRELSEVLTGVRPVTAGEVRVKGRVIAGGPAAFLDAGIGHVPEDRLRSGLAPSMAVTDNTVLREYRQPPIKHGPLFALGPAAALARRIVADASVLVPNMRMPVRNLSGGNQQRLVARREMRISHTALVAAYPTRGLDVGAIELMLRYLIEMRDQGIGVLLVSEELEELLGIADRVAVMFQGRIMGVFPAEEADAERIGLLMGGRAEAVAEPVA
jgi:simple sugar transport system ATP-binding protein